MTVLVLTVCPVMADRRGGNQSILCLGACRCLVEDEGNRQVSQKLKALEQSQKQLTTIIIGGAHDDGSHGPKCLMGLRPAGDANQAECMRAACDVCLYCI